jgi:hypothetical protein
MNCKTATKLFMHDNDVMFFDLTKQETSKNQNLFYR